MTLVPTYPLGMHVVLRGGPFRGEQGIVVDQDSREANRPKVGLYRDREGQPANQMVRTVEHRDISIRPVKEPQEASPAN